MMLTIDDCEGDFDRKVSFFTAEEELTHYNIIQERRDILKKDQISEYDRALLLIFECIMRSADADPKNGDYWSDVNDYLMKMAGEIIYKEGGRRLIRQTTMIWIPKRYKRYIDNLWNDL